MGSENDTGQNLIPDYLLEKVLRPYFVHKEYFFATDIATKDGYIIDNVRFLIMNKLHDNEVDSIGYHVTIRCGGHKQEVDVPLDEILVFIFEHGCQAK